MDILITFTLTLIMFAGVALIFRKPLLWYLKIDQHLDNQKEIITLLQNKKQQYTKPSERHDKNRKKHHYPDITSASQK